MLRVRQQFLEQLLPRPQPGEFDLDIGFAIARKADQLPREVDDLHRLAHVENKNLPRGAHQRGLQHELRRLGDGHEVALDVRVGDSHRSAARDLFAKTGDHAAGAAEHVAKTHDDELGGGPRAALGLHRLAYKLSEAFGRAHHVRWVYSLVSGDQDELLYTVFSRGAGHGEGAEDVVLHGLPRVVLFHQRDVFVGGRMEDHVRLEAREHFVHARRGFHVADHRGHGDPGMAVPELGFDRIERELGHLQQNDPLGRKPRDLPAQLRADRAARTRDEDPLSVEQRMQSRVVQLHRVAAEEVVQLDLAQLRDVDLAGHEVRVGGHGHYAEAGRGAQFDCALARGVRVFRHRDDGLPCAETLGDLGDLLQRAMHLYANDFAAALAGVVVEQCHDAPLAARGQFLQ